MGLDVKIKGLDRENTYHASYIGFAEYRRRIADAYNKIIGELYRKTYKEDLTKEEIEEWNKLCNENLDIFLWHSDCDGKFTPKECKKIYDVLKTLNVDMFYRKNNITMHELWLNMFKHCYKRRVNMYFY